MSDPWETYVPLESVVREFPGDVHVLAGRALPFRVELECDVPIESVEEVATDDEYSLPVDVFTDAVADEILTEFARRAGHAIWDGPTHRPLSVELSSDSLRVVLGRSSFFKTVLTNFAPALRNYAHLRRWLEPGPALAPLGRTRASSHVGVSVMLRLPGPDEFVIPRRANVVIYDGMWGPAACGAADEERSLVENAKAELREEMGVPDSAIERWSVIGFARDTVRLGEPELYVLAKARGDVSRDDVERWRRDASDAKESSELDFVRAAPEALASAAARPDSSPMLWAGVYFAIKRLTAVN